MTKLLVHLMLFIFWMSIVYANGVGNEIEKIVDSFSFEFGIEPKELKANEKAIMSLSIHNVSTGEALKIDDLWIRISKGNQILFTSSDFRITQEGPMFFGYLFKESGSYAIDFSAKYNGKEVKTSFDAEVKGSNKKIFDFVLLIGVFVLGFAIATIMNKLKHKRKR